MLIEINKRSVLRYCTISYLNICRLLNKKSRQGTTRLEYSLHINPKIIQQVAATLIICPKSLQVVLLYQVVVPNCFLDNLRHIFNLIFKLIFQQPHPIKFF